MFHESERSILMKNLNKRVLAGAGILSACMLFTPLNAFAAEDATLPSMYATFWALVPPIVAILLALITKEVYSSLFIGILVGGLFFSNFSFEGTVMHIFNDGFIAVLSDSYNVGILVFLVILGAMVSLMNRAGGSAAFGEAAKKKIKSIYTDSCHLDRKRMAGLIFSDHQLLMRVNKVVHSAVKDDFMRFAREVVSRKVFCESAILGSSGFADMCSRIWLVEAPEFVRINRVRHRNGMDEEEIRQRMYAQRDEFSLLPSGKIVCVPNDGMTELLPFILGLLHDVSKNITKHTERFQKT